ncbi:hypothetical protein X777_16387, partial [Ooceraea biroi]
IISGCIKNESLINESEKWELNGITNESAYTMGSIVIKIFSIPVTFHVVPNDFPCVSQGILSSAFFYHPHNGFIDYQNKRIIWHENVIPFKSQESIMAPPHSTSGLTRLHIMYK